MLQNMLGLTPAGDDERPMKRTQADKWAPNMEAAAQFHTREGHLNVPRKHLEQLDRDEAGVKLGTFIDNNRRRADKLTVERREALTGTRVYQDSGVVRLFGLQVFRWAGRPALVRR